MWVEAETAAVMAQGLAAGCALDLYAPREFPALYW